MNESNLLQILMGEFRGKLEFVKKRLIKRNAQFAESGNKIKVAIGMRRAGKTYFLFQHILKILEEGVDSNSILYINFEDDRLFPLHEKIIANFVDAFYSLNPKNHDRKCYFFFDEIQNVENWPLVIRRLHDTKNAEFFLTGSSAKLLSKEIATNLRGRSLATEIWPFSFQEYLCAQNPAKDTTLFDQKARDILQKTFLEYLAEGGFPELFSLEQNVKQQTLQEYLDVTIFRDLVERHNIKNHTLIKHMLLSMIHNVGKPFAVNKFYNDTKTQGYSTGKDILYDYLAYIEDAYIAFPISIYDLSIRKVQTNPKKLYAIDPGLVRALTLDFEKDLGRLFENIVFLDLKRLGCKTSYYLTKEGYEVDFVAETLRGAKYLFQVTWDDRDEKVMAREKRALEAAQNELKIDGEIVTLESYLRSGIAFRS